MLRRILTFALALSIGARLAAQQPQGNAAPARPTLVVMLTIDQMQGDYYERFKGQLTGGLKRLFEGGAFYTKGYQDHGITETAPGHASTLSGRFPVHTGIATNREGVNTREAPLIGAPELGASPFRFLGTTLVDWMKAADPNTRFLSVSRKDRGAILPIGWSRGPVYWYSPSTGLMTTSTFYVDTLPTWVQKFNARMIPSSFAGKSWTPLKAASAYTEPDSVPIESLGTDFVFPHVLSSDPEAATAAFPNYPWMDDMTLSFALQGVRELKLGGEGNRTDLLAVSLSTLDAVGHKYGPDSKELHDFILRLDLSLGAFFDTLYAMRDQRRVVIAMTGDHGMSPFPQLKSTAYPNGSARQVTLEPQWTQFKERLQLRGIDSMAVLLDGGLLMVLDTLPFKKAGVDIEKALTEFGRDVMMVQGVQRADLVSALTRADTVTDHIARRWLHTVDPRGPVRLIVTLTPFSYWSGVKYATHGSPHDTDAHVPIVFYGAGVKPGVQTDVVRVVDIAPTLAAILGIKPLQALDGRILTGAVR